MAAAEEYQQVAQKLDTLVEVRQKLQIQFNENNQVKEVSYELCRWLRLTQLKGIQQTYAKQHCIQNGGTCFGRAIAAGVQAQR